MFYQSGERRVAKCVHVVTVNRHTLSCARTRENGPELTQMYSSPISSFRLSRRQFLAHCGGGG